MSAKATANLARRDTRGASSVEYIVLIGALVLGALAGFRTFGHLVAGKANEQAACVGQLGDCAGGGTNGATTNATIARGATGIADATSQLASGSIGGGSLALANGTAALTDGSSSANAALSNEAAGTSSAASASSGTGVVERSNGAGENVGSTAQASSKSAGERALDVGKGVVVDGLWGTGKGIVTAFIHPLQTIEGLGHAVAHPVDTLGAIKDSIVERWNENPDRLVGAALFEVATAGLVVGKAAKAAGIAGDVGGSVISEAAGETTKIAKGAEVASEAAGGAAKSAKASEAAADVASVATKSDRTAEVAAAGAERAGKEADAAANAGTTALTAAPDSLHAAADARKALRQELTNLERHPNAEIEARVQAIMDHDNAQKGYLPGLTPEWNVATVGEMEEQYARFVATGQGATPLKPTDVSSQIMNYAGNKANVPSMQLQVMNRLDKMGRPVAPDQLAKWWSNEVDAAYIDELHRRLQQDVIQISPPRRPGSGRRRKRTMNRRPMMRRRDRVGGAHAPGPSSRTVSALVGERARGASTMITMM